MTPDPEFGIIPLAEVERAVIAHAIVATNGNVTLAAEKLGIGRTTLYRKIKDYMAASAANAQK